MKTAFITCILAVLFVFKLNAQADDEHSAIKLFISQYEMKIANVNDDNLQSALPDRLFHKMTQIINQTGVAEIGYSSFLLSAKFDVISTSSSQTGISNVYLAECELDLSVKRTSTNDYGEATFNSTSKTITGSGSSKKEAIINALSNLSGRDKDIVNFLNTTKTKIDAYYQTHCADVIKQAEHFLALKNYEASIALYFSVPSNAPCYKTALDASQKVYATFIVDQCNKKLVKLKAYVALAQTQNTNSKNYYDSAMAIMSNLSPSSDKCYIEAANEITKIEKRLGDEKKEEWELVKKLSGDHAEIAKERYKAMSRISNNYQPPPPSTNVIIAH